VAGRQRYRQRDVVAALAESRGLVAAAARTLGCSRNTVLNYVGRFPAVAAALAEAREVQLDLTEERLFDAIDRGELVAVMYYLRTVGRSRGYSERHEVAATVDVGVQLRAELSATLTALMEALDPFPEARVAVAARLLPDQVASPTTRLNGHGHPGRNGRD
jgi:hypothetical protein